MRGLVTSSQWEGLEIAEAEKKALELGFKPRVVEQDGKAFILTMEVMTHRINFRVRDGLVIEAYAG